MKQQSKFNAEQQQQQESASHEMQQQSGREFETVEEALRCDAAQTEVPPAIAVRLQESINRQPAPAKQPWWRRFL